MGRPKKIVDQVDGSAVEEEAAEAQTAGAVASDPAVGKDGKVPVMKDGVTRRIYPGQLAAWRGEGWK